MKKLLAFILCFALLLSFAACQSDDAEEPIETVSNEEQAKEMYDKARAPLDAAANISLELLITTLSSVEGDEYSEQSAQTLTYQAVGTEEAMIMLEEEVTYSVHEPEEDEDEDEDEEDEPFKYTEIWYKDQVYAQVDDTEFFSGAADKEAAAERYTPVVLLNAANYASVSFEAAEGGTCISFAEPTAAESWAIPQDAQMQTASGSAMLNAEGALTEMEYSLTYTYGPSEVTVTVQSKPLDAAKEIAAPENTDKYVAISNIGAIRLMVSSMSNLVQADSIASSHTESMVIQAAGVVSNQSTQLNVYGRKEDTKLKQETTSYFATQSPREESTYEVEEIYQDGKLTTTANKGLPSTSTIDWEDIRAHIGEELILSVHSPEFWQDATVTDLGSVYYAELVLSDNFGNTVQNSICTTLWNDPSYLYNLADEYKNVTLTGYLSVDKYTGIMVAAGYCFEGVHTIKGREYKMTVQYDQSYEAPAKGAYLEITGERLPEEEPENKPTPLFYHVTGAEGQEMWLFGTIHVGDERTAYLPEEIKDAFTASDALALECNTKLFEEQLEEDERLAEKASNLYFLQNGKTLDSFMEEEDYQRACTMLKAVGGNNMNMPHAKPCLWSNTIEDFYLRQCYQLHADQGVEERLMLWAEEQEKEIREIESSMAQMQMFYGFSMDLQLVMLMDTLQADPNEYWTSVVELYELWCAGNEADLLKELEDEWDTSELTEEELAELKPLMEEYNKAMSFDRNEGMLKTAIEYLESGEVIFYAVGLAHLLDNTNGLVQALRDAGYTVELVTYN